MIERIGTFFNGQTNPYRNLAMEEYLTRTVEKGTCILYLWQNQNTVVIGRNQNAWKECRTGALEESGGFFARRLSGGGAVYHDLGNLNFTFSVCQEDYDLRKQQRVILEACRLLGIQAELSGRNDLLANGGKFSGNSFYSHDGKAFHNGTLLLDVDLSHMERFLSPSKAKIVSKGVDSVRARVVNLKSLCPELTTEMMCQAMNQAFEQVYGLTAEVLDEADFDQAALVLGELYQMNEEPIMILAVLAGQLRQMWSARLALESGKGQGYVADLWKLRSSWQAGNLMRSARQFDLKWCRNAVALAAETDLAMKSTSIDREELLTDLLLKLAAG